MRLTVKMNKNPLQKGISLNQFFARYSSNE